MFRDGFNCAQSVLSPFAADLNLDTETALKISSGFGGGMARMQDTCGAVTGAIMAIGFKYGNYRKGDDAAKENAYRLIRQFSGEFKTLNKTLMCKDLLGIDLTDKEEQKKAKEAGLFVKVCEKCITDSVTILERILS